MREYSNSVTRSNITSSASATNSASLAKARKQNTPIAGSQTVSLTNVKQVMSPKNLIQEEPKEIQEELKEGHEEPKEIQEEPKEGHEEPKEGHEEPKETQVEEEKKADMPS